MSALSEERKFGINTDIDVFSCGGQFLLTTSLYLILEADQLTLIFAGYLKLGLLCIDKTSVFPSYLRKILKLEAVPHNRRLWAFFRSLSCGTLIGIKALVPQLYAQLKGYLT